MKKTYLLTILSLIMQAVLFAQTSHTITTSGYTFVPASVNANVGDTIIFNVNFSSHPLQQVDSATWAANQATPLAGGFSATSGNSFKVVLTQAGVVYYVCAMHVASFGMKGKINVSSINGIGMIPAGAVSLYPNPVDRQLHFVPASSGYLSYTITDMLGRAVLQNAEYASAHESLSIDVSHLSEGEYILSMTDADGVISQSKVNIRR